jgi:hypothetical protein
VEFSLFVPGTNATHVCIHPFHRGNADMTNDPKAKTHPSRRAFPRTTTILSSILVVLGSASPVLAQAPKDGMARCDQLYSAYSRYSGRVNYSHPVDVAMALEDCRKGNFAAGIAGLTGALQRAAIPVPPVQTAASPH